MKTVHEVSALTGVSVRTLHHYDAIGLLKPTQTTEAGYRLYDGEALSQLQLILLLRELEFPLKEIAAALNSPGFNRNDALARQICMLELRRKRTDELIAFARRIMMTGVDNMDFSAFDKKEIEEYAAQAKALWGKTEAYAEYERRTAALGDNGENEKWKKLMDVFAELGKLRDFAPESPEVQAKAGDIRRFITDNFYNCTVAIFRGLGQMYSAGGSMTENIDKAGGEGTAKLASEAIAFYCENAK